jgi:hypothetical protein
MRYHDGAHYRPVTAMSAVILSGTPGLRLATSLGVEQLRQTFSLQSPDFRGRL